jgi:hypothetical protein
VIEFPPLQPLLRDWQKRLRLEDWDIKVKYAEIEGYGRCRPQAHHKVAQIEIKSSPPKDNCGTCEDIEVTLVHELLHVRIDQWLKPEDQNKYVEGTEFEAFIEQISQALVAAKRGLKRVKK